VSVPFFFSLVIESQVLKNALRRITSVLYGERSSHNLATLKRFLRRVLRRALPPR